MGPALDFWRVAPLSWALGSFAGNGVTVIAILDCDGFDAAPVRKAFERIGGSAVALASAEEWHRAEKIVIPSVKSLRRAMADLRDAGILKPLFTAIDAGCPVLAISSGMHILMDVTIDGEPHTGLGIVHGKASPFDFGSHAAAKHFSTPHQGWNQVFWKGEVPLMQGLSPGDFFYFDHSICAEPMDRRAVAATANHGHEFCAAIQQRNVFGTQFLPERSDSAGQTVLSNFVKLSG